MRLRPALALVATLLLVAPAASGCMRASEEEAREERAREAREAAMHSGATRRYALDDADGERLLSLERRGPTVVLDAADNQTLARASIRRDAGHVVARDGGGRIVGQTRALPDAKGIELVARNEDGTLGEPLAALRRTPAEPGTKGERLEVFGADAAAPVAALTDDGSGVIMVVDLRHEPTSRHPSQVRLAVHAEPDGAITVAAVAREGRKPMHRLEPRAGLTPLGVALLMVEALPHTARLALAVHLAELAATPAAQTAAD